MKFKFKEVAKFFISDNSLISFDCNGVIDNF